MSRGARLTAVQRIGMEQRHDADRVRHVCGGECMSARLPLIIGILSASATAALAQNSACGAYSCEWYRFEEQFQRHSDMMFMEEQLQRQQDEQAAPNPRNAARDGRLAKKSATGKPLQSSALDAIGALSRASIAMGNAPRSA